MQQCIYPNATKYGPYVLLSIDGSVVSEKHRSHLESNGFSAINIKELLTFFSFNRFFLIQKRD